MEENIAKQKLNVILLIDTSKSMSGERISQVNGAICDIQEYLKDLQEENSNIDFYLSLIQFSNESSYYNEQKSINVKDLNFKGYKCCGWGHLHYGYQKLNELLHKESKGGIMPDFGGLAPIILLLTDGHVTGKEHIEELKKLQSLPWFKIALKYGIAIELNDKRTLDVLRHFVCGNGDVISCYNPSILKNIIKIIVLTASKVKSKSSNISTVFNQNQSNLIQQQIGEALSEIGEVEW